MVATLPPKMVSRMIRPLQNQLMLSLMGPRTLEGRQLVLKDWGHNSAPTPLAHFLTSLVMRMLFLSVLPLSKGPLSFC
jgi:hypothetical protein